jgi:two-component system, NtrC family, response regulator AtoC
MKQDKYTVLVVDDELSIRNALKRIIDKLGYNTILADSGESALKKVRTDNPDIVYLDLRLPGMNGLEALERIKAFDQDIVVFLISAYGTFKDVVEAIRVGAFDYIQKPFANEAINISLLKAAEAIRTRKEVRRLRYKNDFNEKKLYLAASPEMCKLFDFTKEIAKSSDTSVLIQGETGVGKEIVAQIIHYNSPRRDGPFLCLNCGAFPKELLESELFGYNKGAFTGAEKSKPGLFELAEEGTLLLDEVGDLSHEGQVKLLRILENGTFFRVGGTAQKRCDVRILASTNRDLVEEIKKGNFREDLYYRLNVIRIRVPPLRERKIDIVPLAEYFTTEFSKKFKKNIKGISSEVKRYLFEQNWRGNVRELRNAIERSVLLEDKEVLTLTSVSQTNNLNGEHTRLHLNSMNLHNNIRSLIQKALLMSNGNQVKAAEILGVSRSTLRYKIQKYHISCEALKSNSQTT